jgi:c-di-GMP-binding flagellar brake protein YcgR
MADDTGPIPRIEPVSADHSKYLVHSRMEIAAILNTLCKSGTLVTAQFGGGADFILTCIAAVRPEQDEVIADFGANATANERALQAGKVTFVAMHERIKIQFVAEALRRTRFDGRDAFAMRLPSALLRLQRREYFRVSTPLTRPLKCVIGAQAPQMHAPAEVTIIDISCGGIAVMDAKVSATIETGTCFRGCRILLPDIGAVTTHILVRSTYEVTLKNGTRHKRAGCEFLDMTERDRALIQRYINKIERERRDRGGR